MIEAGNWRNDQDLAEVYTAWGGFAYGRDLDGAPAREDMEINYRRIAVAAKNVDTVEHDIADSDDYYQYHGGMIATVRALTGAEPKAYVGDSTSPDAVRTRSLTEETARVFRARVVNPRWIGAMQRHGYKGAFELAATVDYLYGFDATTGVITDGMYAQLATSYVLDKTNQDFMKHANPWALRGIIEKLNEAADRGLWAEPDPELMAEMQQVYLDIEGDLEDDLGVRPSSWRMAGEVLDLDDLDPAVLGFLTERHLATLTTLRADRTPHVVPVGFSYEAETRIARVITSGDSQKAVNAGRDGAIGALCQVDRARWLTLSGPIRVSRDPDAVADAVRRYAGRYRQPRENPKRVVLVMDVTRILGHG